MLKVCMGCMRVKCSSPVCERCQYDERSCNSEHQLPVGTEVGGQYILGRAIGQGGFGITYIAWDKIMNTRVAVKEYFPKGYASRSMGNTRVTSYDGQNTHDFEYNKQRFLREAESLGKLWDIPQIVKVLRHFESNGTAYIAMEYVDGMDLRTFMKSRGKPLSVEETLTLLGPVIQALGHVHEAKLVHRDIAPDNIMVLPDGSSKLLDFGAARYVENADADHDRSTSTQAILKDGFAPPEQYRSHGALGPWSDVYAMCATIYYCLTGKVPPEAMARTMEEEPINWNLIRGLSPKQEDALKKGLALRPSNRYTTVGALWEDLRPDTAAYHEKPVSQPSQPVRNISAQLAQSVAVQPVKSSVETSREVHNALHNTPPEALRKKKKWIPLTAAVVLAAVISVVALSAIAGNKPNAVQEMKMETVPVTEVSTQPVREESSPFTYRENTTGITVTGYTGDLPKEAVLPDEIHGKPVTAIGFKAFYAYSSLEDITIPKSVTTIGDYAFADCMNLSSVELSEGLTSVGSNAFYNCKALISIELPEGVTSIGNSAFSCCRKLNSITIPKSITSIGSKAFFDCVMLKSVNIPSGCDVASDAFQPQCTITYY